MGVKLGRDVEKTYSKPQFIASLRRLADTLERGESYEIRVAGERVYVPAHASFGVAHEKSKEGEELEFQIQWQRR